MDKQDDASNEEFDEIEKLLNRLSDLPIEHDTAKNPLHAKSLRSAIEQYLSPFIVFGYDVSGNAVVISNAQTQQDFDGLALSIDRYMTVQDSTNNNMGDEIEDY